MNIAQALEMKGEIDSYERQEAAWLLEHIIGVSVLELKFRPEQELTEIQQQTYLDGLARIEQGEPLAYVTGSQPFWTLDLKVTHDTLVPRPDTEILVETVLNLPLAQDANIVDLGTGTGAIALALASERPQWHVTATDIYQPTLDVAKENALKHGLSQVRFACGAWFEALDQQKFDLIVSNPPYIDPDDIHMQKLKSEPERALIAANHGLADIETIISQGKDWLKPNGWIALEHGYDQGLAVRDIFERYGFNQIQTIQDYGDNDRVTLAQLLFLID
ncbi:MULTISPECIES: peptide chain release factor N(5)-glutamine methyltransferase [unclassified Acinetobacter]|uniref:peptide chain release factor N(5)-glutamine methyltransferase n=1 Tax=unclassified Acinetobacter TaxID=196816 RepID=UPI0024493B75|nr:MULTISPECIES: peptide chain release factor N(5)-glutamine methyltransferase [unclassified Acinetobacter]MDH0031421.1 peptide chain release factor N(5)-glutamine methyltransferase [Acinetobacter sp. GD04021]MDH0887094.1 peptide chain release factor N(5)-glutamine methyltransferase [Acinetobacter sp. GD03873]MDH1083617.1 peptide chain release factor N(5)-glutamine methyltransferase [Acinetobacter sp. GD03983]MDH2190410.1 peptide chain release factor N(5)-glutamine methyltransferase [Acinetobac